MLCRGILWGKIEQWLKVCCLFLQILVNYHLLGSHWMKVLYQKLKTGSVYAKAFYSQIRGHLSNNWSEVQTMMPITAANQQHNSQKRNESSCFNWPFKIQTWWKYCGGSLSELYKSRLVQQSMNNNKIRGQKFNDSIHPSIV